MLANHLYNLLMQLVIESKSLKRIKNDYINEVDDCEECRVFWEKMIKEKESRIEELSQIVRDHFQDHNEERAR